MNKLFFLILIIGLNTLVYAKLNVVVSVLPQKTFVEIIGAEKIDVNLMVKPGNSPHSYEPKPSQMKYISNANIYFTIGVEFEKAWLPRFANQNQNMKIVNLSDGILKTTMVKHEHSHEHEHNNETQSKDPHIWTSPQNVKIIALNIYKTLVKEDSKNQNYYKSNYDKFINIINNTDKKIKNILKDVPKNSKFMVFHPAWGYFAQQYNLIQLPIEVEGKEPKPKAITKLIKEAKQQKVKAVFTAPEFSQEIAHQIANELGVLVIQVSPLNPKWSQNLQNLAKAIAGN